MCERATEVVKAARSGAGSVTGHDRGVRGRPAGAAGAEARRSSGATALRRGSGRRCVGKGVVWRTEDATHEDVNELVGAAACHARQAVSVNRDALGTTTCLPGKDRRAPRGTPTHRRNSGRSRRQAACQLGFLPAAPHSVQAAAASQRRGRVGAAQLRHSPVPIARTSHQVLRRDSTILCECCT